MKSWLAVLLLAGPVLAWATAQSVPGLAGYWELDEVSGPTAADVTSNNNAGTWVGAPAVSTAVPAALASFSARCLSFDGAGTDDYVEIPNSASLENVQEGDYTLSAWFMPGGAPSAAETNYGICVKGGWNEGLVYTQEQRFSMEHWLADTDGDGNPEWASVGVWWPANTYPPGSWYHVAGVINRTAGTAELYVNGELVGTNAWAEGPGAVAYERGATPWRIGIASPPGSNLWSWPANGSIDDVRIYSRALTQAEVQSIATGADAGPGTAPPPPGSGAPPPPVTFPTGPRTGDNDNGNDGLNDRLCGLLGAEAILALLILGLLRRRRR